MSVVFIVIGAAHAIPPLVGAKYGKTVKAVYAGAAVGCAIALATGNPAFIFFDLVGVGIGTWLGMAMKATDAEHKPVAENRVVAKPLSLVPTTEIQRKPIGRTLRSGIEEYPSLVSVLLEGSNEDTLSYNDDGTRLILTVVSGYCPDTPAGMKAHMRDQLRRGSRWDLSEFVDALEVRFITPEEKTGHRRVEFYLPDEVVLSEAYLALEIKDVGRVFIRNYAPGNDNRWLLMRGNAENKVAFGVGRALINIDRKQLVPALIDYKEKTMSERQITANIQNRLWNRLEVRCISMDDKMYRGELLLPAAQAAVSANG